MDLEVIKLLSQFGFAGVLLAVLGTVLGRIGVRVIAAIDRVGTKADGASQRVEDKLDAHTKADTAAWNAVGDRIDGYLQETSKNLAELKQDLSDEFATVRRDLAVLGTRIDVVLDRRPIHIEDEHSHRTLIPVDRHMTVPQSGTPVADRLPRRTNRKEDT